MRRADASAALLVAFTTLFGTAALLGTPTEARAQDSIFAPYVAVTTGGDTRKNGATFGFSTAYLEESDWGGEFDLAYVTDFNDIDFESTSIATVFVNLMVAPKLKTPTLGRWVRPFAVAGLGLIRARGCDRPNCVTTLSRTSLGLDAGGGVLVPINDIYGIRGDVRYFRYAMNHADLPRTGNGQFDFWRLGLAGTVTW